MSLSKVDKQTGDLKTIAGTPSDAIQVAYNNANSGLTAGNVQSAIDEVNARIPVKTVKTTSPYTKLGFQLGAAPGFIRSRSEPLRSILILGNSLTGCHVTYTVDGETIDELREVGATRPDSGWTSLIYKYLKTIYPDIKIYKTNAAIWEQTSHATGRNYNLIKDLEIWEFNDAKNYWKETSKTVNDVLPQADIVTIQLFENVGDCAANQDVASLTDDYVTLYKEMNAINGDAYYNFWYGFWYDFYKKAAVLNLSQSYNVWGVPSFLAYNIPEYYCGGVMQYGIDGSEVGTIMPAAATHPSDYAFYQMACTWLYSLFNTTYKNGTPIYTPIYTPSAAYGTYSVFEPPRQSSYDFSTDYNENMGTDPIGDRYYLALPGRYVAGLKMGYFNIFSQDYVTAYGVFNVTFVDGSYVQDFDSAWFYPNTVMVGFTIKQCLLYVIDKTFQKTFAAKYAENSRGFELKHEQGSGINANNIKPYHPAGFTFLETGSRLTIRGICDTTKDKNFPAGLNGSWYSLYCDELTANYGRQIIFGTSGVCYYRIRGSNSWTDWIEFPRS